MVINYSKRGVEMQIKCNLKIKNSNGWFKCFPPAGGEKQWSEGFSAMEFAKAVTSKNFEKEVKEGLGFTTLKIDSSQTYPERLTYFDDDSHGPRHHDMASVATADGKNIVLCFEAKVNESLDSKLEKYNSSSEGKKKRIDNLCEAFFGRRYNAELKDIYYQMLSGLAGTVAFAAENNAQECYFIVYQLLPKENNKVSRETKEEHKKAISDFLQYFKNKNVKKEINNNVLYDIGDVSLTIGGEEKKSHAHIVYMEKEC